MRVGVDVGGRRLMRWTRHGIACMACSRWPVSLFSGALLSLVRARALRSGTERAKTNAKRQDVYFLLLPVRALRLACFPLVFLCVFCFYVWAGSFGRRGEERYVWSTSRVVEGGWGLFYHLNGHVYCMCVGREVRGLSVGISSVVRFRV